MESRVLRAVLADGRTVDFVLDQPVVTVGRSEENPIHLDDLSVSRRHARLSVEGDDLYVEDLGSGAGTHLGGQQLTPRTRYLVRTGDTLRFGDVQATWLAPEAPAIAPEAQPSTAPVVPAVAAGAVVAGAVAASLAVEALTADAGGVGRRGAATRRSDAGTRGTSDRGGTAAASHGYG
jgi:predicted component of type VI protein secretion system